MHATARSCDAVKKQQSEATSLVCLLLSAVILTASTVAAQCAVSDNSQWWGKPSGLKFRARSAAPR